MHYIWNYNNFQNSTGFANTVAFSGTAINWIYVLESIFGYYPSDINHGIPPSKGRNTEIFLFIS